MDELRNILVYVRHLKIELNSEDPRKEQVNFYIDSIIERAENELKREKEEAENNLKHIEELNFLINEYLKK